MSESYTPYVGTLPDGTRVLVQCYDGVPSQAALDTGLGWGIPADLEVAP